MKRKRMGIYERIKKMKKFKLGLITLSTVLILSAAAFTISSFINNNRDIINECFFLSVLFICQIRLYNYSLCGASLYVALFSTLRSKQAGI